MVRIWWFHPVGWCVVLQRHYDGRSCMAVAFLGAVQSVSLIFLSAWSRTPQRLHEVEKVVSRDG
jgi:hypothetical protein